MGGYLAMGGYALYVWSAYAVAFVIMAGMLAGTLLRLRGVEREVALLERQRPARRRPPRPVAADTASEVGP